MASSSKDSWGCAAAQADGLLDTGGDFLGTALQKSQGCSHLKSETTWRNGLWPEESSRSLQWRKLLSSCSPSVGEEKIAISPLVKKRQMRQKVECVTSLTLSVMLMTEDESCYFCVFCLNSGFLECQAWLPCQFPWHWDLWVTLLCHMKKMQPGCCAGI